VSPEELYEQATGKRYAPAVDWSQADPEYLFQAATTGRPVEDIRDAALERARQGDQARTSGQFAQGAVSRFFERQLGGFKPGGESTHEMLGREVVPLARGRLEGGYREARRRFDAAQASDQDLALIARYEAIQRTEQGESTGRAVGRALAGAPKVLLEASAGGRAVGLAARGLGLARAAGVATEAAPLLTRAGLAGAAKAAPGQLAAGAAATPLIPDLYYADAQQRATKNGGEWYDSQNIAPAAGYAVLQSAVLGHAQRVAGGATPTLAGRAAVGGGVGFGEQQLGDAGASLVDDFLIKNDAYKVGAKYGALVKALKGEPGAEKELAAQIVTFSLFSALQGPKPKTQSREDKSVSPAAPTPERSDVPKRLIDAADIARNQAAARLVPRPKVAAELKSVGDRWVSMLEADPATAFEAARELYLEGQEAKGTRWTKPYEKAVAAAVLQTKARQVSGQESIPGNKSELIPQAADPFAGIPDADLSALSLALTGKAPKKRAAAITALRDGGVTDEFVVQALKKGGGDIGREGTAAYLRPDAPAPVPPEGPPEAPGSTQAPEPPVPAVAPEVAPAALQGDPAAPEPSGRERRRALMAGLKAAGEKAPEPQGPPPGVLTDVIRDAGLEGKTIRGDFESDIQRLVSTGPDRKMRLEIEDNPVGRFVSISFEEARAAETDYTGHSKGLRKGTIDVLRDVRGVAAAAGAKDLGVSYNAENKRHELYARQLEKAGFELVQAEPPTETYPFGTYYWQPKKAAAIAAPEGAAKPAGLVEVAPPRPPEEPRPAMRGLTAPARRQAHAGGDVRKMAPEPGPAAGIDPGVAWHLKLRADPKARKEAIAKVADAYSRAELVELAREIHDPAGKLRGAKPGPGGAPFTAHNTSGLNKLGIAKMLLGYQHVAAKIGRALGLTDDPAGPRPTPERSDLPASKPKAAPKSESLAGVVKRYGGIAPDSEFKKYFSDVAEAKEYGVPLAAISARGKGIDVLARELHEAGFLADADPQTLLDALGRRRKAEPDDQKAAEHAMEADARARADEATGARDEFLAADPAEMLAAKMDEAKLTKQQRAVVAAIVGGEKAQADIARGMGISAERVRQLKVAIEKKMGIGNIEAILKESRGEAREDLADRLRALVDPVTGDPIKGEKPRLVAPAEVMGAFDPETGKSLGVKKLKRGEADLQELDRQYDEVEERYIAAAERDSPEAPALAAELTALLEKKQAMEAGGFGRPLSKAERGKGRLGGGQPDAGGDEVPLKVTALANAKTDAERAKNGLAPILGPARLEDAVVWDRAMAVIDADPQLPFRLAAELSSSPRATTVEENAVLLRHKVAVRNEWERAMREFTEGFRTKKEPAELDRLEAREKELYDLVDQADKAAKATGTEWGRAGRFRRVLAAEDFSLAGMLLRAEAAAGRPLTPEEKATVTQQQQGIAAAAAALEAGTKTPERADLAGLRIAVKKAKAEAGDTLAGLRRSRRSPARKVGGAILETGNIFRQLQTAFDLSGLLRQGGFFTYSRPGMVAKGGLPDTIKALFSEGNLDRQTDALEQRAKFPEYQRAGIFLGDVAGGATRQEEGFAGRFVRRIPILGAAVKASERAYTGGLNRIRADAYDALSATLVEGGKPTDAEVKWLGRMVNTLTGRGSLKNAKADLALGEGAAILFSPRYLLSRMQLATGQPIWSAPTWRTKALAAKEYGRALMGAGVVYLLASLFNEDEEITFDPRSSDFGKVRFGNTRLDPMLGLSQLAVFGTRAVSGETVNEKGKAADLREPAIGLRPKLKRAGSQEENVFARFLRSKLAPVPGGVYDLLKGQTPDFKPATPREVGQNLVLPFGLRELEKVMTDQGMPRSAALTLLAILGMGVAVHEPKKKAG
jgi:DNA-binding CsgD family transcriptional regulator